MKTVPVLSLLKRLLLVHVVRAIHTSCAGFAKHCVVSSACCTEEVHPPLKFAI